MSKRSVRKHRHLETHKTLSFADKVIAGRFKSSLLKREMQYLEVPEWVRNYWGSDKMMKMFEQAFAPHSIEIEHAEPAHEVHEHVHGEACNHE